MSSNKPFPSSDLDVFKENSLILDNFVNSQENEHPDRFARKRPTITGIIKEAFNVRTDISNMNEALIGQSRWDVVPKNTSLSLGGDNGALNKQAQALFNRTVMLKAHAREALRRTYQEVGLNLVDGSFEQGAVITSTTDVVLHEKTGKCYSGPIGTVAAGTNPASSGFVDRSGAGVNFTYDSLRAHTGSSTGRVTVIGRSNIFDGGQGTFFLLSGDKTTADNDCTVIVDADGRRWRRDNTASGVNVAWAGAVGAGGDDYIAIVKSVAAAGKRGTIYIPGGFNCGTSQTINLNDTLCSIAGDGPEVSKITALPGLNTAIISQLNTVTDGGDTFERIEGVGIYGNYSPTLIGINQRYTSRSSMRNVLVQGCHTGLRQIDNFVHMSEQVEIKDCKTCLHLVGSNHGSEYIRLGVIGFGDSFAGAGEGILIEYSGGDKLQSAIAFRGCDIEFGVGDGVVCASTGTILFDGCYMEKVRGRMFVVNDGDVVVNGGEYIIYDATGHLVDPVGGNGRIYFDNKVGITSDGVTRLYPSLIKVGGTGKVYFKSSSLFTRMLTTNNGMVPNNLGRLARSSPYLKPQGRHFSPNAFSGGVTQTTSGDTKTFTCNTAGNIGVYQQMTLQPWVNENTSLVVKYTSNISLQVTAVGAAGQSGPITTIGSLPNTGGSVQIAVFPNARITDTTQQWLEFWKGSQWQVGDTLTLHEVWWCSGDSIRNGELSLG